MVMTDHKRRLRNSDDMMAELPQATGGSEVAYGSRLAYLAMENTRMKVSNQEFVRSFSIRPDSKFQGSPFRYAIMCRYWCAQSHWAYPGWNARPHMPPIAQYTALVPPRFVVFSGEGLKQETLFAQWRSEVQSVWQSGLYQEAIVMTSIKCSLRGRAADVLLAIGTGGAGVSQICVSQVWGCPAQW